MRNVITVVLSLTAVACLGQGYSIRVVGPINAVAGQTLSYEAEWYDPNGQQEMIPMSDYSWTVQSGTAVGQNLNSSNVQWTTAGTGSVRYQLYTWNNYYTHVLMVTVEGPPATPNTTATITQNCGVTEVVRHAAPPAGAQWYWQTSPSGTSSALGSGSEISRTVGGDLYLRARRTNPPHVWSASSLHLASIALVEGPPAAPSAATDAHLIATGGGTVVLSVSPVSGATAYRWYTAPTGGVASAGVAANTHSPMLASTTTFYVESVTGNCPSPNRRAVTAYIYPVPVIVASHNGVISMGSPVTLSLPFTYDTHQWLRNGEVLGGATSATLIVKQPGNYTVRVTQATASQRESSERLITSGPAAQNLNYVVTNAPQREIASAGDIDTLSARSLIQTIRYFDGLSRLRQTVATQSSPTKKDIVQPVVYDAYGREAIKYLPYISTQSNGWFKANALNEQGAFFATPPAAVAADTTPYAVTVFESSPLDLPLKQGAPGTVWQPDNTPYATAADYTVKYAQETNGIDEVFLWTYTPPTTDNSLGLVNSGTNANRHYYAANELYKNKTKDEHHHEVIEYVDKEGRTILKKVQASATEFAQTYYIYDDFGNLVVVLPPEAVKALID